MSLLFELIVCGMGLLFVIVVMTWIAILDMAAERARLKTWRWTDLIIDIEKEGTMKATPKQLEYIADLLEASGESEESLCDEYVVQELSELTIQQASSAIDELKVLLDRS